ncbi:hypothetical protein ANCDUO_15310 [Ancylostoma duodenale]|uniref:Uncharacterized protein n=1 Tax=Ancylostoma duodenale TaxID=51022 RepID=A0A0C2CDZ2_9BILA|nr:hypothetical protein ANCDUO_15310 [Ancylostoma duodenale]
MKGFAPDTAMLSAYLIRTIDGKGCQNMHTSYPDQRGKLPTWLENRLTWVGALKYVIVFLIYRDISNFFSVIRGGELTKHEACIVRGISGLKPGTNSSTWQVPSEELQECRVLQDE